MRSYVFFVIYVVCLLVVVLIVGSVFVVQVVLFDLSFEQLVWQCGVVNLVVEQVLLVGFWFVEVNMLMIGIVLNLLLFSIYVIDVCMVVGFDLDFV